MPKEPERRTVSGTVRKGGQLVLIIEDHADIRGLYAVYLRRAGFRVAEASNGVEGVERALAIQPALVVMDLQMPCCDGYEATRRLKHHPKTRHIPVIVASAYGYQPQLRAAADAGCDEYLVKPVQGSDLIHAVLRVLDAAEARKTQAAAG